MELEGWSGPGTCAKKASSTIPLSPQPLAHLESSQKSHKQFLDASLLKQKVDFLLWGGWDVNLECFHWARLLLGRYHELWTCAISNQNWRFSDCLGIAGYKVVLQMTVCSSANPNAADRWENDSENDAAACSSSWNQTCLCTSLLPNTYGQNTEKNFCFVISWSFIYVRVFASTGKIEVHSMLRMQGWDIAGVSTKVNKRCS